MIQRWPDAPPRVAAAGDLPPSPPSRRLRVLHVITRLEAGAGGNTLLSAEGMDASEYDVWIAGGGTGPLWERAHTAGIRTVVLSRMRKQVAPADDLRTLAQLIGLMRREKFDVVHVHSAKAGVLGRVAATLCRVPVLVCTIHGRDPWWPAPDGGASDLADLMPHGRGLYRALEIALRPLTDSFVAVSPTVARDAVRAGVAAAGRTTVAPSAVDVDAEVNVEVNADVDVDADVDQLPGMADAHMRAELGLGPNDVVIGTVGRLDRQKAPLDFVRMAALLVPAFPHARFVIVGDGELIDHARRLAEKLRVPLILPGFRPDAAQLASCFDVYVVTSRYEGVGRGVTEAMASARPVVATAVDGVVDVVAHGSTGLLVRPGDVSALAAAVEWLLRHPAQAALMGEQARGRVRAFFTRERMCAVLDEVYRQHLGVSAAAAPDPTGDHLPTMSLPGLGVS